MGTAIFALPVQSGRTRLAMHLLSELEAADADWKAMQRAGISSVAWYLMVQPAISYLIAQIEGAEPQRGFLELTLADGDDARRLRAALGEIGGMEIDARTIERLMHSPLAHFPVTRPPIECIE